MDNCPFEPLNNMLIAIEHIPEATKQGIVLPESAAQEEKYLEVLAVGPDVVNISTGDSVLPPFHHMAIRGTEWEGVTYFMCDASSIPAKVL